MATLIKITNSPFSHFSPKKIVATTFHRRRLLSVCLAKGKNGRQDKTDSEFMKELEKKAERVVKELVAWNETQDLIKPSEPPETEPNPRAPSIQEFLEANRWLSWALAGYEPERHIVAEKFNLSEDDVRISPINHPYRPVYFIAIDHSLKTVILCVRGTISARDIVTDAAGLSICFKEGFAHRGMLRSAVNILRIEEKYLENTMKTMGKDYKLVLTGHSLGAGVASLIAMLLKAKKKSFGDRIVCWGYGCPPVVTKDIAEESAEFITTIVHEDDVVCRIGVHSLRELSRKIFSSGAYYPRNQILGKEKGKDNGKSFADGGRLRRRRRVSFWREKTSRLKIYQMDDVNSQVEENEKFIPYLEKRWKKTTKKGFLRGAERASVWKGKMSRLKIYRMDDYQVEENKKIIPYLKKYWKKSTKKRSSYSRKRKEKAAFPKLYVEGNMDRAMGVIKAYKDKAVEMIDIDEISTPLEEKFRLFREKWKEFEINSGLLRKMEDVSYLMDQFLFAKKKLVDGSKFTEDLEQLIEKSKTIVNEEAISKFMDNFKTALNNFLEVNMSEKEIGNFISSLYEDMNGEKPLPQAALQSFIQLELLNDEDERMEKKNKIEADTFLYDIPIYAMSARRFLSDGTLLQKIEQKLRILDSSRQEVDEVSSCDASTGMEERKKGMTGVATEFEGTKKETSTKVQKLVTIDGTRLFIPGKIIHLQKLQHEERPRFLREELSENEASNMFYFAATDVKHQKFRNIKISMTMISDHCGKRYQLAFRKCIFQTN